MAPDTPNKATAQGPIQHKPIKEAKALILMAPPVVAAAALSILPAEIESIEVMTSPFLNLFTKNQAHLNLVLYCQVNKTSLVRANHETTFSQSRSRTDRPFPGNITHRLLKTANRICDGKGNQS
jgi:hypothetical protein